VIRLAWAIYLRFWLRTDIFMGRYTWADAWEVAAAVTRPTPKARET
jgi:hypothetical protein